jgi:hypothetical protein
VKNQLRVGLISQFRFLIASLEDLLPAGRSHHKWVRFFMRARQCFLISIYAEMI